MLKYKATKVQVKCTCWNLRLWNSDVLVSVCIWRYEILHVCVWQSACAKRLLRQCCNTRDAWRRYKEECSKFVKAFNMPSVTSKRPKYYTPNEVSVHNTLKDLWVSFLGKVYDLTPMCERHAGKESFKSSTSNKSSHVSGTFAVQYFSLAGLLIVSI